MITSFISFFLLFDWERCFLDFRSSWLSFEKRSGTKKCSIGAYYIHKDRDSMFSCSVDIKRIYTTTWICRYSFSRPSRGSCSVSFISHSMVKKSPVLVFNPSSCDENVKLSYSGRTLMKFSSIIDAKDDVIWYFNVLKWTEMTVDYVKVTPREDCSSKCFQSIKRKLGRNKRV